jgi:DNA-binding CsgD family transcriptional regulator
MANRGFIAYHKALFGVLFHREGRPLSIRGRLQLSLLALSAALIFCTFFLLSALNLLPTGKNDFDQRIVSELDAYEQNLHRYFSNTAGMGINMSRILSRELSEELGRHGASIAQASDDPKLLLALEERAYSILQGTLLSADCSGAFVMLDATVNSSLPNAHLSRAGVYLKLANINKFNAIDPDLLFVRGMHEVGTNHRHIFHNKWELEFSISRWDIYEELKRNAQPDLNKCYMITPRVSLQGTWETMMLFCVPILDSRGNFLGICGLEINSLFYKLALSSHAFIQQLTGLIACREGDVLRPDLGLESGTLYGYFAGIGSSSMAIKSRGDLNRYESEHGAFVGLDRDIALSPLDGANHWVTAILIPESIYAFTIQMKYLKVFLFFAGFLLAAYLLCYRIGRRFIDPILDGIDAFTRGDSERTEIPEIDDLIVFLSREEQKKAPAEESQNIDFKTFAANVELLSKAERAVFDLYMKGFSAPDIANQLYISINTIKSHNKRIYKKLNVSSRKELLFYAKLMNLTENDGSTTEKD